jgi:tetratricopeptide (TPR) repeat protein
VRFDSAFSCVAHDTVYVRGEAYLKAGRTEEAAAEFQRVLHYSGIVLADPIGALAHLQLGRALELAGDHAGAKAAYDDFFNLWTNADQDLPVLIRARADYKKLKP